MMAIVWISVRRSAAKLLTKDEARRIAALGPEAPQARHQFNDLAINTLLLGFPSEAIKFGAEAVAFSDSSPGGNVPDDCDRVAATISRT
jgi:hypothetical protein